MIDKKNIRNAAMLTPQTTRCSTRKKTGEHAYFERGPNRKLVCVTCGEPK